MPHFSRVALIASLLLTLAAGALVSANPALGYRFGSTVKQLAPEQTVFDWSTQRCDDLNIPDLPARAYRDASNQVHLTLSHYVNRQMIGPALGSVVLDCNITMSSHMNADPAAYDDNEWIAAPYTLDGTKVYALVHEEYHGWEHPGECSAQGTPVRPRLSSTPAPVPGADPTCWYNSVTLASSSDGGRTYTHATPPLQRAISSPYPYVPDVAPYGYFSPSNIIKRTDGYYYALVQAEPYQAQQAGTCVIRSKNPSSPVSWRAWNGTSYSVQFIDPYTNPQPPEQHVCQPVAFNEIEKMEQSLTFNSFFNKYLLIGVTSDYDPGLGRYVYGVYYSTSTDLITWSHRILLMEAEVPWSYQCGDDNPITYPTVIDPASQTRNFETTSQKMYLYFTRFNYVNCVVGLDRDLIRIPFQFLSPVATH